MKAYAWQNGLIEFGQRVPAGALQICAGKAKPVRAVISTLARMGWNGDLIVPGIPECEEGSNARVDILIGFAKDAQERLSRW